MSGGAAVEVSYKFKRKEMVIRRSGQIYKFPTKIKNVCKP